MSGDYASRRLAAIKEAAFAVLAEKGYKAASVLEIAKRAGSSNETLYKWFGNKQGLFRTLVEDNASEARELLEEALAEGGDPLDTLSRVGPVLLTIVTSEKAVALNRAAAGDVFETATLGRTIADNGRETIVPLLTAIFEKAADNGALALADPGEAAATFVNLLIGDLQIRRVIGVADVPTDTETAVRGARAVEQIRRIYAAG